MHLATAVGELHSPLITTAAVDGITGAVVSDGRMGRPGLVATSVAAATAAAAVAESVKVHDHQFFVVDGSVAVNAASCAAAAAAAGAVSAAGALGH